jgi:hypothetical protein
MSHPGRPRRVDADSGAPGHRAWPQQFSWDLVEAELDLANVLLDVADRQARSPENSAYRRAREIHDGIVQALAGNDPLAPNDPTPIEALRLRLARYLDEAA